MKSWDGSTWSAQTLYQWTEQRYDDKDVPYGDEKKLQSSGPYTVSNTVLPTKVSATAVVTYSHTGADSQSFGITAREIKIAASSFANLKPTLNLTCDAGHKIDKVVKTEKPGTDTETWSIAGATGDKVTITAEVDPKTPAGWEAKVEYRWDDDFVEVSHKEYTIGTGDKAKLDDVKITYTYKENNKVIRQVEKLLSKNEIYAVTKTRRQSAPSP